jgi:hypothetical protein
MQLEPLKSRKEVDVGSNFYDDNPTSPKALSPGP